MSNLAWSEKRIQMLTRLQFTDLQRPIKQLREFGQQSETKDEQEYWYNLAGLRAEIEKEAINNGYSG